MKKLKRVFAIRKKRRKDICKLTVNGTPCSRDTHSRGICQLHQVYLLRHDKYENYADKSAYKYMSETKYRIRKNVKQGQCRMIEDGKGCNGNFHGRGLCQKHWLKFERHGLLDKYGAISQKRERVFKVKKKIIKGVCRVTEDGTGCKRKAVSWGLCSKHYTRFLRYNQVKKYGKKVDSE